MAAYAREKCPPGIRDVMAECTCGAFRTSYNVRCTLGGATYTQLPTFEKINGTVEEIVLEQGTIEQLHDGVFNNLSVSAALNLFSVYFQFGFLT